MVTEYLDLNRRWMLGPTLGHGGFGDVLRVTSNGDVAAAKLVPKEPGADRELLFEDLGSARNVIPVIDKGETADSWVIVMPLAEKSLRDHLTSASDGRLGVAEAVTILRDLATGLDDLDGRVVHRDLKPENVLLLDDAWCLSDFGIARYVEATTATDTWKDAMSAAYAAPERWRLERAETPADVYSLGVIAFELLVGEVPFPGPTRGDYQDQHLNEMPPEMEGFPGWLEAVIQSCLSKMPGTRPSPESVLHQLKAISRQPGEGLARLQEANRLDARRQAERARQERIAESTRQTRQGLSAEGVREFGAIGDSLRDALLEAAPNAEYSGAPDDRWAKSRWEIALGSAILSLSPPQETDSSHWGPVPPPFDVVCHATLSLKCDRDNDDYMGRAHSLWFCDAVREGEYHWYETAFMEPGRLRPQVPFAIDIGRDAAFALSSGTHNFRIARAFMPISPGSQDFIERWADWLARASQGALERPTQLPEHDVEGTWRRT